MAVKLYVDKIEFPASKTEIKSRVEYNCKTINPKLIEAIMRDVLKTGNTSTFLTAGRYFCGAFIDSAKNSYKMIFADLRNNDDTFHNVLQGGFGKPGGQLRENAIHIFNRLKPKYEKNYNDVELIEGDPPNQ